MNIFYIYDEISNYKCFRSNPMLFTYNICRYTKRHEQFTIYHYKRTEPRRTHHSDNLLHFMELRIESETLFQNSAHNSVESRNTGNKREHLNGRNVG